MNTIEKASLENSKLHYIMAFSEALHFDADMDFRAGVAFAQRWIPVEEEMPEYGIPVLVKFINGTYGVGYHLQHERRGYNFYYHTDPSVEFSLHAITHWRPIELK